ncbi:MAG: PIN domain-containing protein [Candidatus Diapherotrites archaeon]|nr:PIN domain-containing protein [Candidatus Diapherotrites archaeon]
MIDDALVDTNLLVYIIDKTEKHKYEKANKWIKSVKSQDKYFVALQNLREFSNIARKKSGLSAEEITGFLQVFSDSFTLVFDSKDDLLKAVFLSEKTKTHFWDILLACTMQRHGIQKILTENTTDFKKIPEIEAINPFEKRALDREETKKPLENGKR